MLISIVVLYPVRRFARQLGLLDRPGHRKVHTVATPLGGGIGIWAGVLGVFAIGTIGLWVCNANDGLMQMVPQVVRIHADGAMSRLPQLWGIMAAGTVLIDRKSVV